MPIDSLLKNSVTANVAFSVIKMCVTWKWIEVLVLEDFKNGKRATGSDFLLTEVKLSLEAIMKWNESCFTKSPSNLVVTTFHE